MLSGGGRLPWRGVMRVRMNTSGVAMAFRAGLVSLLVASACGCHPLDPATPDAGGADASSAADVDASIPDAGADEDDAFVRSDADGDGVATAEDCDDADVDVGRSHSRSCDNACGPGEATCADGAWSACDAPADCFCAPDATRVIACGRCGMQAQRCGAPGTWEDAGECLYQGMCDPGTVEDIYFPTCGHHQRLCGADCSWLPWEFLVPIGECRPGERVLCWDKTYETCSPTCTLECRPYF